MIAVRKDRNSRIVLPRGPEPLPADMSTTLEPLPGKVVVRPLDCQMIAGLHQIVHEWGPNTSMDCGHVLAVGEGVPLDIGDFVVYRPFEGLWLDRRTRVFGQGCPWYDQVVARITGTTYKPELEPLADWVLVQYEKIETLLTPHPVYFSRGQVISAGPDVPQHLLGKRAEVRKYITPSGPQDHGRNLDFARGMARESWGLIPVSEIVATYL